MNRSQTGAAGDLLYGVRAIAAHLGVKPRQAQYLCEADRLPVFREGRTICSKRSALDSWLGDRTAARHARLDDPFGALSLMPVDGSIDRLCDDIVAGKNRLVCVLDPDAGSISVFGLQRVESGHGGFVVRQRDGAHIGAFADLGTALAAGVKATDMRAPKRRGTPTGQETNKHDR